MRQDRKWREGQAAVMVLAISLLLIFMVTTMVAVVFSLLSDTTMLSKGEKALFIAETAAEDSILRLLRNPDYAGDTNIMIGGGSADVVVTGVGSKTLEVTAFYGETRRNLAVEVAIVNGELSVVSWGEE